VRVSNARAVKVGDFASVTITGADAHDLTAKLE